MRSPKSIAADDSSLGRGNWNEDHIILVTAPWGFSLSSHRADNHEWYPLNSHHLPNGVFLWKQLLNNRLADDRQLGRGTLFLRAKRAPTRDLPFAGFQVTIARAVNRGKPVAISTNELGRCPHRGRCDQYRGRLFLDGPRIRFGE